MERIFLPEALREELKKPFGKLYVDTLVAAEFISQQRKKGKKLIAVGDVALSELIVLGIVPELGIYDLMTKREPVSSEVQQTIESAYELKVFLGNERSSLNLQSMNAIDRIMDSIVKDSRRIGVHILGEEDLVALHVLANMSRSHLLVYGQPDKGLVVVEFSGKKRDHCRKLIKKFHIEQGK